MKIAYPIILEPAADGWYVVTVPDLGIHTEGRNIADAIDMAADAISLTAISLQDSGQSVPAPSEGPLVCRDGEIPSYAVVDFDAYRRMNDMRTVRKNVTLPNYLNEMAMKAGLNFSQVLQEGLKERLGMS
ncbi:MAG: type II toxin-antitoxin system HicB family antitoxin [Acutalibacter sp.]|nr:type II toxin-antitoxin system HicB family antitoxin [Acutalibacter sp.]